MRLVMRIVLIAAVSLALLRFGSSSAFAVAHLPSPLEDVTKLEKPTVSYVKVDPVRHNAFEIRLIDLDGRNDRLWMHSEEHRRAVSFSDGPQWSPDGKWAALVMFDSADASYTPYILNLETGQSRNLKIWASLPKDLYYLHFSWSPNSRWLAMAGTNGETGDIYKLNVYTGKLIRLTRSPAKHNWLPDWSPDGQRIAYRALSGDSIDIYAMDAADGNNRVNLTNFPGADSYYATWSPDGSRIAFTSNRSGMPKPERWADAEMYAMRPDGSNVERLTFNNIGDFPKDWSPDGKWLIYTSFARRDSENVQGIYRMHIETREVRLIKETQVYESKWVLAGKSRFLSVDPADKKHGQWGDLKEAEAPPEEDSTEEK